MPTRCSRDNKGCYCQWGSKTKYYYKCGNKQAEATARVKADKQGTAAHATGYQGSMVLQLQTFPASYLGGENTPDGLHTYRKELIKVGSYVKASTNQAFKVTKEILSHWANTFHRWVSAGNKVPIPLGHGREGQPEANAGWVTNMFVDDGVLVGIMNILDPQLALTTDVSICVEPDVVDGKGNKYSSLITHVALCTDPVVPGLKDFETLSLSKGVSTMEFLKKLAVMLGITSAEPTEEEVTLALSTKLTPVIPPATITASQTVTAVDPLVVKLMAENNEGKLNTLVNSGIITPAIKDIIAKEYVEPTALTLTLSKGGDNKHFDLLYNVLLGNTGTVKLLDEKSGPQVLELANTRQMAPNVVQQDIKVRREAAGMKN